MLGLGFALTSRSVLAAHGAPPWVYAGSILDLDFINQRYWWNGSTRTTANFTTYVLNGSTFGATGLLMTDTIDVSIALSGVGTVLPGAFALSVFNTTPPIAECWFSMDGGTANDRINANQNTNFSAQVQVVAGGAVSANIPSAVLTAKQGISMSYTTNDFKASVNGGALTPDVTGTLPTLATLKIGKVIGGNGAARGGLGRLILFAVIKTQAELNALSTAMQSFFLMHITPEWQDASGGFRYVVITAADHLQHVGLRGIEARMRQASAWPASSDQGDVLLVKAQAQQIALPNTSQRLWLKSLITQFDAVVTLSTYDTMTVGDSVSSYQMRRALGQQGKLDDAYAGLGDMDAVPRIQWDSAGIVVPSDELSLNIQATLAYSTDQMAELFAAAREFPPKAWG